MKSDIEKLAGLLMISEKTIVKITDHIITEVGRRGRSCMDAEEDALDCLSKALEYVKKAEFCVKSIGFDKK